MTLIAFRDVAYADYSVTTAPKNIIIPASTTAGDLMLLEFQAGTGGAPTAAPSGWAVVALATLNSEVGIFQRLAQSGDASSVVTVTQAANTRAHLVLSVYSNPDNVGPLDAAVVALETVSGATHAAASVTPSRVGWLHRSLFLKDGATVSTSITPPAGFTTRRYSPPFTGGGQITMCAADSNADVTTSPQTGTWTVDQATANAIMVGILIRPSTTVVLARPVADISLGTGVVVGGVNGYSVTADDDPGTYIEVSAGTTVIEEKIATLTAAPNSVTVKNYGVGSPASMSVTTRLMQGGTIIATFGPETAIPTTEATYTYTVTAPQQAAITDLTDLRLRTTFVVA